jgi:glycosyltransferase involved in cell wall biosynthesis
MGKKDKKKNDKYPFVSICTPTFNRRPFIPIMIKCFEHQKYPKDKIEWLILDDGTDKIEDLVSHIPQVKYFKSDEKLTLGKKRNFLNEKTTGDIIIYMDDDDYYPPESILARVKILLKYKSVGIECCGSTLIGTYNLLNNESSMSSDGPISLSEASMAYTKKFWEERPFDDLCIRGEHKSFTEQRLNKIIDIPYSFILIAINHKSNFTDHLRGTNQGVLRYSNVSGKEGETANFFDTWDYETQIFIMELRNYIIKIKN